MICSTNVNNLMVYWFRIVFFSKNLYPFQQVSIESIAGKRQNLLRKEEPKGVYNRDLYTFRKKTLPLKPKITKKINK